MKRTPTSKRQIEIWLREAFPDAWKSHLKPCRMTTHEGRPVKDGVMVSKIVLKHDAYFWHALRLEPDITHSELLLLLSGVRERFRLMANERNTEQDPSVD